MSAKDPACSRGMRVAFIHPDLGLGGAERLVVDAATELVRCGHHVDMYTAYYNPQRCFEETKSGGFAVHTAGSWFPRHILGRMFALCAYIRCILVAIAIAWRCFRAGPAAAYDVIIADQVAAVVPVVKLLMPRTRVLFYCHFPDLLLTKRESLVKRLYRAPLDYIEEVTTGAADLILVNSNYTRGVFGQTFRRLAARGVDPGVLYPAVPIPPAAELQAAEAAWRSELDSELAEFIGARTTFLSINRFERKKGIGLALEALHELLVMRATHGPAGPATDADAQRNPSPGAAGAPTPDSGGRGDDQCPAPPSVGRQTCSSSGGSGSGSGSGGGGGGRWVPPRLVVAGGYDPRLAENVEHLAELREAARALDVGHLVRFVPSFSDRQRTLLLAACRAVLYTPQHEHFGIVPLEAMAAGRPVVACNSGGPTESVAHGSVGFLCDPTPAAFAGAMQDLMAPSAAEAMGRRARAHVQEGFSRGTFGRQLDGYVRRLAAAGGGKAQGGAASRG